LKKLLLLVIAGIHLAASDIELATKIYKTIAVALTSRTTPVFYIHGDIRELRDNRQIRRTDRCREADIVIISTLNGLPAECLEKPVFASRYRIFRQHEEIVGAFFWQKGRPNIIFSAERLQQRNIRLGSEFESYIE
jgi:hypothetical protein